MTYRIRYLNTKGGKATGYRHFDDESLLVQHCRSLTDKGYTIVEIHTVRDEDWKFFA